jgi:hypothetical protein
MKIIALLPFKNEELFLPMYLASVRPVVDQIIAMDDRSTDRSRILLERSGATVYSNEETLSSGWAEFSIRQKLLDLGRQAGGTHFVCLDADEAFTMNVAPNLRSHIIRMQPGQKLILQWIALWKSCDAYRDDDSIWSRNFKDFIVYPSSVANHEYAFLGVGRTPGHAGPGQNVLFPTETGGVLHFQFVPWERFQIKQAWYRCSELLRRPQTACDINETYTIGLDDPDARTQVVPLSWLEGLPIPPRLSEAAPSWQLEQILHWFDMHTVEFFEPLQIWHCPILYREFIKRVGREPIPRVRPPIISRARHLIGRILPKALKDVYKESAGEP